MNRIFPPGCDHDACLDAIAAAKWSAEDVAKHPKAGEVRDYLVRASALARLADDDQSSRALVDSHLFPDEGE